MIIYHPAYDVHHCTYRLLHVLSYVDGLSASRDVLRLIDFYYLYPHLLKKVHLPRALLRFSSAIAAIPDPFEVTPNPRGLFFDLSRIHDTAVNALAQRSVVSVSPALISLKLTPLPEALVWSFKQNSLSSSDFFRCLVSAFPSLKLEGRGGFKDRSGLMEYRYD